MATPRAITANQRSSAQYASVADTADILVPSPDHSNDQQLQIVARLRECLVKARDPDAAEWILNESMCMCSRLLTHYNVVQTRLPQHGDEALRPAVLAGASTIGIFSKKGERRVINEPWVTLLCDALAVKFDCGVSMKQNFTPFIEWTFYGDRLNTVAAAMTFEAIHNLVIRKSNARQGSKSSYRLGIATGLMVQAKEEEGSELQRVRTWENRNIIDYTASEHQSYHAGVPSTSHPVAAGSVSEFTNIWSSPPQTSSLPSGPHRGQISIPTTQGHDSIMTLETIDSSTEQADDVTLNRSDDISNDPFLSHVDANTGYSPEPQMDSTQAGAERSVGHEQNSFAMSPDSIVDNDTQCLVLSSIFDVVPMGEEVADVSLLTWQTSGDLIRYRHHSRMLAEAYRQASLLHLSPSPAQIGRSRSIGDYNEGLADSRHFPFPRG